MLQGLGTIQLDTSSSSISSSHPGSAVSAGTITFQFDKKAQADESFITYISKETGKIKPLATSDLESFIETGRQLLNISKPFILDGIGQLQLDIHNQVEFIQADFVGMASEQMPGKKQVRTQSNDGIRFDDNYMHPAETVSSANGSKAIVFVLFVAGIGLIGWVSYFFYNQEMQDNQLPVQTETAGALVLSAPPLDSQLISTEADTTSLNMTPLMTQQDTLSVLPTSTVENFKLVLEISRRKRAFQRFADLKEWGHKVVMTTTDSIEFKLAIPVFAPLSDSSRHRDSLSNFFGRRVWIESN